MLSMAHEHFLNFTIASKSNINCIYYFTDFIKGKSRKYNSYTACNRIKNIKKLSENALPNLSNIILRGYKILPL